MRAAIFLALASLAGCDKVFGLEGRGVDARPDGALLDGLVAHYSMNTITDVLDDESGNVLTGLCHGMRCPEMTDGAVAGGLHFDGNTAIGVNHDAKLDTRDAFTAAGWYRLAQPPPDAFQCPFNTVANAGENSWQLCFANDLSIRFISNDGTANDQLRAGIMEEAKYHHIALWWDGNEKRVYVDGLMVASSAATIEFTDGILSLGADFDGAGPVAPLFGAIDDARLYNRALGVGDILDLVGLAN
jgi:hypothetical protein